MCIYVCVIWQLYISAVFAGQ